MPETKKYLNRDGLEEYNSLLPHSSSEIQEYVDDWLDAHPEATTTVPDDGITTRKLADGSVTRNKLAADVAHLLGGMMVTGEVQGEILTADDAYSVAPLSMEINGKSTQVTTMGKNLFDKDGTGNVGYYKYDTGEYISNTRYRYFRISVAEGDVVRMSPIAGTGMSTYLNGAYVGTPGVGVWTYTIPAGVDEISGYFLDIYWNTAIVTKNNPNLTYEPYTGGKPSPNPDYPQPIVSVEVLELPVTFAGESPYVTPITANIPMQGHVLRSLPDGTHDIMSLSYLRESDRSGWAWYSREVVQRIDSVDLGTLTWATNNYSGAQQKWIANFTNPTVASWLSANKFMCSGYKVLGSQAISADFSQDVIMHRENGSRTVMVHDSRYIYDTTPEQFRAAVNGVIWQYILATPITTQLDPIELPVLPAPNCTVWSDPSTGLKMSYMRDANIVVSNIEQAIADL